MKKAGVFVVIFVLLGLMGIFGYLYFINSAIVEKGALQITSNIKANIEIDGEKVGQTPLCKCNQDELLKAGTYEIKMYPEDKNLEPFTIRAKVEPNVLTALDRTFLPGSLSSAYVVSLEKQSDENTAGVFVASIPNGALITIDSVPTGVTPYTQNSISPSEHQIEIQKQGFAKKTIRIRTAKGFKLIVNIIMGLEADGSIDLSEAKAQPTKEPSQKETIEILDTPTGFLRVRSGPGTSFDEVDRISPGESYVKLGEENDWYQIELQDGKTGWISSEFAQIKRSQ